MNKPNVLNPVSSILIPILLMMCTFTEIVQAGDTRAIEVVPDNEIRSRIISADGYAQVPDIKTVLENKLVFNFRQAAIIDAKRNALEMARTHIKSEVRLENGVLKYDLVWAASEGQVSILEMKDYGIENDSRYHVWIRAEVGYTLRLKDQAHSLDIDLPLTVKVWTPEKVYRRNEKIEISLEGNRDFHARIVNVTPGGPKVQLLPNDYRQASFFKARKTYRIPDDGDQFSLIASAPFGEERIIVYASELPLGPIPMEPLGKGLRGFRGSTELLSETTRIKIEPEEEIPKGGADFYQAEWTITTRP